MQILVKEMTLIELMAIISVVVKNKKNPAIFVAG